MFIELIYQTLFNFFVKKDGYSFMTHILVSILILGIFFLIITGILFTFNIISNHDISLPQDKGLVWLINVIAAGLNYFFLFRMLKIEKEGNGENRMFYMESKKSNGILRALLAFLLCWSLLALVYTFN